MKSISLILAFIFTTMTIDSSYANAKMISTQDAVTGLTLSQERENILSFIQRDEIQKELVKLGVDPIEANQRIASLSAKEVNLLSKEIEKGTAGGDFGVGSLVGTALFVFLVLLITDILGYTKVFPFTRSVK